MLAAVQPLVRPRCFAHFLDQDFDGLRSGGTRLEHRLLGGQAGVHGLSACPWDCLIVL
jgi:hypothetical protein